MLTYFKCKCDSPSAVVQTKKAAFLKPSHTTHTTGETSLPFFLKQKNKDIYIFRHVMNQQITNWANQGKSEVKQLLLHYSLWICFLKYSNPLEMIADA